MDYKATLLLPKTDFPMKADLPKREPAFLEKWNQQGLYQEILKKRKGGPRFLLHDGPPFANGDAHMGHALNITLKDIVLKFKNMTGHEAPFVPGWDCHGLPIEHKVMKELGGKVTDPATIRPKCEAMARHFIDVQREQFKRLGVFGDWENPYLTMDPGYEAEVLRVFAKMVEQDLVSEGLRSVHWSTGCQTALAEAEIEYQQKVDPTVYAKFELTPEGTQEFWKRTGATGPGKVSLLIWTTTPWSLPANLAVAASNKFQYGVYQTGEECLIAMPDLAPSIPHLEAAKLMATFGAKTLESLSYRHPFLERVSQVYLGDLVHAESGTGLVHIAPGHGEEDYLFGQEHGLGILSPVDDEGRLTQECGVPSLVGQNVFDANPSVIALLKEKGALWAHQDYTHDYPHCWRSKTPIVFRAVKQWFIDVDKLQAKALAEIENVSWVPDWGKNRIRASVQGRAVWCISRQRSWGIPIPVFYDAQDKPLLSKEIVERFAALVEKEGTQVWFSSSAEELAKRLDLPPELCKGIRKGRDTLDVWIDSGCSHTAVTQKLYGTPQASMYLEGSDQHRGWFQSSLLTSVAAHGKAPYQEVLTNGFVVDLDGKKLSKSNTYQKPMDLMSLVNRYGADILRLWVSSQDYRNDVPFSEEIFDHVADTYRSIRNTLRILLGNLGGFNPAKDAVPQDKWPELEQYVYGRIQKMAAEAMKAYASYEFHQVYHILNRFCVVDLSSFYIDVRKDRMYCDSNQDPLRRAAQTVMHTAAEAIALLLAPLTPYTAEEAWSALGHAESVHAQLFPWKQDAKAEAKVETQAPAASAGFEERWERLLALRSAANAALEQARQRKEIGKSLEARIEVTAPYFQPADQLLIAELTLVSQAILHVSAGQEIEVAVFAAHGKKCVRCWKYDEKCGSDSSHPELCPRCTQVVKA